MAHDEDEDRTPSHEDDYQFDIDDDEEVLDVPRDHSYSAKTLGTVLRKRKIDMGTMSLYRESQDILKIFKRFDVSNSDDERLLAFDSIKDLFVNMNAVYKTGKLQLNDIFCRGLGYLVMLPKLIKSETTASDSSFPDLAIAIKDEKDAENSEVLLTSSSDATVICWEKINLERVIGGIKVLFPFPTMTKPQIQILSKMLHAVKNSEHVVLESPTGTGKTAAILAGLFSWLYQAQILAKDDVQTVVTPDRYKRFTEVDSMTETPHMFDNAYSGISGEQTDSEGYMKSPDSYILEKPAIAKARVVYLTRTHVQIRQVMDAIKKSGFRPMSCTLASRVHLCIYKPIQPKPLKYNAEYAHDDGDIDKNEAIKATCKSLVQNADKARSLSRRGFFTCTGRKPVTHNNKNEEVCPYYANMGCKSYAVSAAVKLLSRDNSAWDIEDLISFGKQPLDPYSSVVCCCDDREDRSVFSKKRETEVLEYVNFSPGGAYQEWEQGVCPYFTSKAVAQIADFVVCPYPYIIDINHVVRGRNISSTVALELHTNDMYNDIKAEIMEIINEKTNISGLVATTGIFGNMSNSILVFDEGHNLENVCIEEASLDMDLAKTKSVVKWLDGIKDAIEGDKGHLRNKGIELAGIERVMQNLHRVITRIVTFLKVFLKRLDDFIYSIDNESYDKQLNTTKERVLYSWDKYDMNDDPLGGSRVFMQVFNLDMVEVYIIYCSVMYFFSNTKPLYMLEVKMNDDYRAYLEGMLCILVLLCHRPECYNVLILTSSLRRYTLGLWLMDPSVIFSELSTNVRSVIIASGTLSPIPAMVGSLGTEFENRLKGNVISATLTLSKDQFAMFTITHFSKGGHESDVIECNFKKLKERAFLIKIGISIANLMEVFPGGTLVFFPNKSIIASCIEIWKDTPFGGSHGVSIYDRMLQVKNMNIFQEPPDAAQFAKMLQTLKQLNEFTVFAVFRSHASEGLNLKLSSLILVGMPFPSIIAPRIDMSRRYHKAKVEQYNWYLRETYRSVNQSIGRCIRNNKDRGVVILMDRRYQRYKHWLSPWVHPYISTHDSVESVKNSIKTSFTF